MPRKGSKEEEYRYIVRIAGTDIEGGKRIPYGLSKIRGIGLRTGEIICYLTGIHPSKKIGFLSDEEVKKLDKVVTSLGKLDIPRWLLNRRKDFATGKDFHVIGSELAMALRQDLNRLRKIRSYRGIRHELGLPVRGQRTRTSFRKGVTIGVTRRRSRQGGNN
jgi:small subunit ribosomal protein S13